MCCSVLQSIAVNCSVLHCVAVYCSVLQCIAVYCSVLQIVAVCCSVHMHLKEPLVRILERDFILSQLVTQFAIYRD